MSGAAGPPVVTVAAEHGAGGDLVAPRVAEALGVPFLDRALPAALAAIDEASERPSGLLGSLARASSMFAGEPVERMDLDEGRIRAELAEFLTGASTEGGVILGRGGAILLADAPAAVHVLLTGDREGRVARVAEREGVDRNGADRRVRAEDRARREYVRRAFGVESDDRTRYHLIIDGVAVGIDAGVELLLVVTVPAHGDPRQGTDEAHAQSLLEGLKGCVRCGLLEESDDYRAFGGGPPCRSGKGHRRPQCCPS